MAGFSGTSHNEKRFAPPLASFTLNQPAGSFGNIFNNATAAFDAITSVWSSSLGKPSSAAIMKAGLAGSEQQLDLKSTVVGLVQLGGLLSVAATYLSPTVSQQETTGLKRCKQMCLRCVSRYLIPPYFQTFPCV